MEQEGESLSHSQAAEVEVGVEVQEADMGKERGGGTEEEVGIIPKKIEEEGILLQEVQITIPQGVINEAIKETEQYIEIASVIVSVYIVVAVGDKI